MPPIIVAFFFIMGALPGSSLLGPPKAWAPVDPTAHSKFGKPVKQGFRTWASRQSPALASSGGCDVTFFAMANRNRVVRARLDGVEQNLDTSFSKAVLIPAGHRRYFKAEYIAPEGGDVLACHVVDVVCVAMAGLTTLETIDPSGPCTETRVPSSESNATKPTLVGSAPGVRLSDAGLGGAPVEVSFVIRGDVRRNEAYYCPKLEVEWPDGTRTVRESDCVPFAQVAGPLPVQRWSFVRVFPAGEWVVKGCISRSGKLVACATVTVRVIGG